MLPFLPRAGSVLDRPTLGLVLLLSILATACAPLTRYRRSALVPAPSVPPFHGEPLRAGQVEASAHAGWRAVIARSAEPGDPALWIPNHEWSASLLVGATDWLVLGMEGTYAHSDWANESAHGTPPLADGGDALYGAGPQLAIGGRFADDRLFASLYASGQFLRVPWATWELSERSSTYRLVDQGSDFLTSFRGAAFFGGRPNHRVAVFGGVAASSTFVNTGFSDQPAEGSTLRNASPSWLPFAGARVDIGDGEVDPFLRATLTAPISSAAADYLPPGVDVAFGVRLF